MKNSKLYFFYLLTICFVTKSCVEPFDFETISFENALVVEATITNEFKHQEINLTRSFQFEEDRPSAESSADVKIIDDSQNTYDFQETTPGTYRSISEFNAVPNRTYQLSITTNDGSIYASQLAQLPQSTEIDDLVAIRETTLEGVDGVSINANSFDSTGNSRYYRYEYEETYKIIPLFWSQFDIIVISDIPPFEYDTQLRIQEERICFNTVSTTAIIQTQTTSLQEDRISQFPIHFISRSNSILRERYSILVKQYVQSLEAYNYYRVLNELSGNESLLSQNQPGFVNGNISSKDNPDEKVLGYFEITSVSSKRIFINFRDIFPDGNRPFYFQQCDLVAPLLINPDRPNSSPLIDLIRTGDYKFFDVNIERSPSLPGPILLVENPCSDCTVLGTNIRPDFWID